MNKHLLQKNERKYEKLNIPIWHRTDITGQSIKIAVIGYGACLMHKKPYIVPVNTIHSGSYHDGDELIHAVAPESTIYSLNMQDKDGWSFQKCMEWVIKNKPDVVCMSFVLAHWGKDYEELSRQAYENRTILVASSGNDYGDVRYPAKSQYWIATGAYNALADSRAGYSNYGEGLTCLGYTDFGVEAQENYYVSISHTSGTPQVIAGMSALLKERMNIAPDEFREFIKENSIDLGPKGWDKETGHGLFILPETIPERSERREENDMALTQNYRKGRNGRNVIAIVNHITAGYMPGCFEWMKNPASKASAHYLITRDGRTIPLVDEKDTAWHAGKVNKPNWPLYDGTNPNRYTIGIEHEGYPQDGLTEAQYQATLRLHRIIIERYNIPIDRDHIIGHYRIDSVNRPNCPGPKFPWGRLFSGLKGGNNMPTGKTVLKLKVGGKTITRNDGKVFTMDVPAKVEKNRTLVPIRAICEALGAFVHFEKDNITITL